ncbi:MAG TPA: CrcB family protein [Acidimicrobiales bacterium]|nr:CrcB family protein [Acidimicrobiales bacterium]
MTALLVALAGGLGGLVRFALEYAVRRRHPTERPWATVAANTLGSAIAGYGAYRLVGIGDAHLRSIVLTGFCGGVTTFSSAFAIPAIIAREHHPRYAIALVTLTPVLCVGGFLLGMGIAH